MIVIYVSHILIAPSEAFRVYQIADKPIHIVLYIVHAPITSVMNMNHKSLDGLKNTGRMYFMLVVVEQ